MSHIPHLHLEAISSLFHHRHMFFLGSIHRIFLKKFHGLAAADQLPLSFVNHFDHVAADLTLVDL